MTTESLNNDFSSLNADSGEVAKFERAAEHWWNLEGEFKPLHDMNPLRANYIDSRAEVAEKPLLDVGCGGGILSEAMAQRGAVVTGIDMGAAPLEVARQHAEQSRLSISYQQITAEQHAQVNAGAYEIVCCLEMLEHVPDPSSVIQACSDLVSAGGHVFLSTINRTSMAYLMAVIGAEYLANLVPKGTHDYQKFITPAELSKACRKSKLRIKDITGIAYNPLTKRFHESEKVSVNYIIHAQKAA